MKNNVERSRWGRSKFGGSPIALLALSLGLSALITLVLSGTIAASTDYELPWWAIPLTALPFMPVTAVAVWGLCVDRSTMSHALKNPEQSIEKIWYSKPAEITFHIMLFTLSVATTLFTIFGWNAPATTLLTVATGFCMVSFLISYQIHKRKVA
ncbi:hypothetical protein VVR12_00895 [Rothia sp. LK2588]|uniref:hypothetical protein n=1 Tax=Rothia sp. LK2588 TaxID=3114369 RepID=UPI0034CE7167